MVTFTPNAYGEIVSGAPGVTTVYTDARDGLSTINAYTSATTCRFGQNILKGGYICFATFLSFDTSGLAGATIADAQLRLYGHTSDNSATDFIIQARTYDWTSSGLETTDWVANADWGGTSLVAEFDDTSGWATSAWNVLTDTGGGLAAAINTSGTTELIIVSSRMVSSTAPSGAEYITIDTTTNLPELIVSAIPSVASKGAQYNTGGTGNEVASHPVAYPATVNSGDLLILFFHTDYNTGTAITWPGTFTDIYTAQADAGGSHYSGAAYRIADGTETGTVTVATPEDELAVGIIWRITGWHGTTPPEHGTAATGNSTQPDPPSLTPSWGSDDTLWIATAGMNGGMGTVTYPTNYDHSQDNAETGGSGSAGGAQAARQNATATEDPGVFTGTSSNAWEAQTIGVRPSEATPPEVPGPALWQATSGLRW